MERCGQRYTPINLLQGKRLGTHFIGGRMGPTAGAEDLVLTGIRYPDSSYGSESLSRLAIPATYVRYVTGKHFRMLKTYT
jgi:hypothetical protein